MNALCSYVYEHLSYTCHVVYKHSSFFFLLQHLLPFILPYEVATITRHLKIIGLFYKRDLQKRGYSAKETYDLKEPTNHPLPTINV